MGKFWQMNREDAADWQFLILPELRDELIVPELFVFGPV